MTVAPEATVTVSLGNTLTMVPVMSSPGTTWFGTLNDNDAAAGGNVVVVVVVVVVGVVVVVVGGVVVVVVGVQVGA